MLLATCNIAFTGFSELQLAIREPDEVGGKLAGKLGSMGLAGILSSAVVGSAVGVVVRFRRLPG